MAELGRQDSEEELGGCSPEEMRQLMRDKAQELFRVCDVEEKGFINKKDMQRLLRELPLSPDNLEAVFDSLDQDGNGFLTLEEFTEGFGSYLGMSTSQADAGDEGEEETYEADDPSSTAEEDRRMFQEMLEEVGAKKLMAEDDTVRALWLKLRKDEPDMLQKFEEFLIKTSNDIKQSEQECTTLEAALKSKSSTHDQEIKRLYEEMEFQIKQERDRIIAEERAKERQLREQMEQEMEEKDRQLQELIRRHQEMEARLENLNHIEVQTKQENDRLLKEREDLQRMLDQSQDSLEESRSYINQLQQQRKDESRNRAKAALQLSEGIALERESLVKQLDNLRDMNRQLRDDKDEAELSEARRDTDNNHTNLGNELDAVSSEKKALAAEREEDGRRKVLVKQGSVLGKYFPGPGKAGASKRPSQEISSHDHEVMEDDGIECDDDVIQMEEFPGDLSAVTRNGDLTLDLNDSEALTANMASSTRNESALGGEAAVVDTVNGVETVARALDSPLTASSRSSGQTEEATFGSDPESEEAVKKMRMNKSMAASRNSSKMTTASHGTGLSAADSGTEAEGMPGPQRLFKVIFVGDSGVGKSTFIHHFCFDAFKPDYVSTIGVDFQTKELICDNQRVALQLWDTAGQERFRSITKQYFRKADGVVVMYDVTSENSFLSIRNWIASIHEVEADTVVSIVGNKLDLLAARESGVVSKDDASRVALEYKAMLHQVSSCTGQGVEEAMLDLASTLCKREDKLIEDSVKLHNTPKKKGCCGR